MFANPRCMDRAPSKSPRRERILIVDDIPENLAVLSAALEPEGYEVLAASNGTSALTVAEKGSPDLILLDVMMPGLDGLQICRELKRREHLCEIPVIFVTARGDGHAVVEGFNAGAVDYIVKPFQTE